jgi:myosin-crossreactive antigen
MPDFMEFYLIDFVCTFVKHHSVNIKLNSLIKYISIVSSSNSWKSAKHLQIVNEKSASKVTSNPCFKNGCGTCILKCTIASMTFSFVSFSNNKLEMSRRYHKIYKTREDLLLLHIDSK